MSTRPESWPWPLFHPAPCRMCGVVGDALLGRLRPWCTRCESVRQACEVAVARQRAMLRVWQWHPEDHDAAWETVA